MAKKQSITIIKKKCEHCGATVNHVKNGKQFVCSICGYKK